MSKKQSTAQVKEPAQASAQSPEHPLEKYFRAGVKYTTCPGCGNGIISQSLLRAFDELNYDFDKVAFVSGIGCSGWTPALPIMRDLLHVTHGRSLAAATGLKLAAPDLTVFVVVGDGDLSAIGGNHFIHAARRNIDIKVICVNNFIYGMTSGQVAPTTPFGSKTATTPLGSVERPFDLSGMAIQAGATFVARWTTYHARPLTRTLKKAIAHRGFSFIEVVSQCPVQYGKTVGLRNDAVAMLLGYKETSVSVDKAKNMSEEELEGKTVVGELHVQEGVPELTEQIKRLQSEAGAR